MVNENNEDILRKVLLHNEKAWDYSADQFDCWSQKVSNKQIALARQGDIRIKLSPNKEIPDNWLKGIVGKKVLAFAAAGGQQAPILAAAGAKVTLVDISLSQLKNDFALNETEKLGMEIIQDSQVCLAGFASESFDIIFNPLSNCFFPDLEEVWSQFSRILRPGGDLLTAFINPIAYCFDFEKANQGQFILKYPQPYSDLGSLEADEQKRFIHEQTPLEFGHTLSQQIGGLIKSGFVITGFEEDQWHKNDPINHFFDTFIVLKAKKMAITP